MTKKNTCNPKEILQNVYGYDEFRSNQKQIIDTILSKKDTLVILPTGAGKSICFQIPALIFEGTTIVVSPLISLMKDQVDALNKLGVSAIAINSLQTKKQQDAIFKNLAQSKYKIVYVSPERLQSNSFLEAIKMNLISLFVVDEAHCISQWGDSFRPEYKKIYQFFDLIKSNPVKLAFTATATKTTQAEIIQAIPLTNAQCFTLMSQKDNLQISIHKVHNSIFKLLLLFRILNKHQNQSGIIFCSTRKTTEKLAAYLQIFDFNCDFYHGKITSKEKERVQEKFITTDPSLVIATNAFGMGIDKSSIRFVIHYQVPASIEDFYQEIGRAGRDGRPANSYLLYDLSDTKIIKQIVKNNKNKLRQFFALQELIKAKRCRSQAALKYFNTITNPCGRCDYCQSIETNTFEKNIEKYITIEEKKIIATFFKKTDTLQIDYSKYPFTDLTLALYAAIQPKNNKQMLAIPGVGIGFLQHWKQVINFKE